MTKTFPEVISGIRTAKKGVEVREDIAQMGEYVQGFAQTATEKASSAASSAAASEESRQKAAQAVSNIDQQTASSVAAVQQAQTTATTTITQTKDAALTDIGNARAGALQDVANSTATATAAASAAAGSASAAAESEEKSKASEEASARSEAAAKASQAAAATSEANALKYSQEAGAKAGTDKTLSIEDAPADAKQTGEELALRYTKEQVDALLAQYKADILLAAYPVGSLYMSADATSPAQLFGGTWEQIKDRFILAAGDTYAAGSTGGEAAHTLTIVELAPHRHIILDYETSDTSGTLEAGDGFSLVSGRATSGKHYWWSYTYDTGEGQPHNNMPPYITKYVWQRIE